jgi:predicted nucleic acid-binding protein
VNWLLDTNTLSDLTKPLPHTGLLSWLKVNEAEAAISAISIGERAAGIRSP